MCIETPVVLNVDIKISDTQIQIMIKFGTAKLINTYLRAINSPYTTLILKKIYISNNDIPDILLDPI